MARGDPDGAVQAIPNGVRFASASFRAFLTLTGRKNPTDEPMLRPYINGMRDIKLFGAAAGVITGEAQERGFVRVALPRGDVGVRWTICSDSLQFWRAGLKRFGGPLKLAGTTRTLGSNFTALISLTGEYDFADAALLERALSDAYALTGDEVIVDLSEATFLDATIVSVFIRRRRACGDLFWVVAPAGGFPHRVLSLCGLVSASAAPSLQPATASAIANVHTNI